MNNAGEMDESKPKDRQLHELADAILQFLDAEGYTLIDSDAVWNFHDSLEAWLNQDVDEHRLSMFSPYMVKGFKELDANPEARALEHPEWLALLLEHEITLRRQKRFEARARAARLRQSATIEDVDYRAARGLDRALFRKLAACEWIRTRHNLIITGPCGVGKSWLACSLGHKACKEDFSVLYHRVPRLFTALALARGDGRYAKLLRTLSRVKLLILDDWGPETLSPDQARDLLEIVEDRYDAGSILLTSQVPIDRWHDIVGNPTLADAILDRVIHNAYRIELAGESMRKRRMPEPSA
jgi:DNA replication protein DnaC